MLAKVIAVANTKGGCGKTTLAVQIAIARANQGKEVLFVDGDYRQQTGLMALAMRDTAKIHKGKNLGHSVSYVSYQTGSMLGKQVCNQKSKWDTIVIDVGGVESSAMRAAISVCDLLLIPFQPRSFDTWAIPQISAMLDEVASVKGANVPAFALINCADFQGTDNEEARHALDEISNIQLLECQIGRRKAFSMASGFGLGVSEMKVKDPKAISEMKTLMKVIFGGE